AVLGLVCASPALADHDDRGRGRGRGNAYGHYKRVPAVVTYAPAVVSARVVDVEPLVRYVAVDRPREQCWNEIVREPVRPFGVAGQTAAGSIIGAAIGRQFGSGNDRDALTVLGAVAGGAVAHRRAVVNQGYAVRDVAVQRCEVVHDRVTEQVVDGYLVTYRLEGQRYTMRTDRHPGEFVQIAAQPVAYRQVRY
ncbi:MAG TPA: glycine zipper 2TM domain-containing protein, partial [Gammaproteobacteria bacterium]|nr:glycine zipper 2TM domain-containing protein [Gammaproteobacteria bacterium]